MKKDESNHTQKTNSEKHKEQVNISLNILIVTLIEKSKNFQSNILGLLENNPYF